MSKEYTKIKHRLSDILDNVRCFSLSDTEAISHIISLFAGVWVNFDFSKEETRPEVPGRYIVQRKDRKTHLEMWNGTGWAYNGNVIVKWLKVFNQTNIK